MATTTDVTNAAQQEAPTCCNQPMFLHPTENRTGNTQYGCGQCGSLAKGRTSAGIAQGIDHPTSAPTNQQEAHPVRQNAATTTADQEHNAALLKRILTDIGGVLHRGTDIINNLNRRNGALVGQVADAGEFAVATQQTDQSRQALDETVGLTSTMDQHLGGMSSAVGEAEQAITAALGGLRVVDEAHDDLMQAGAGTKAAAPARDGA
jgi:hypothetical protein